MPDDALRDDLLGCIDEARSIIDDCNLRRHDMTVRTRTWVGPQLGQGTVVETDLVIEPRPRLRLPENRQWANQGGTYEQGDLLIEKVSATYTRAQLGDPEFYPDKNVEVNWVITERGDTREELYDVISTESKNFEWRVHLRRRRSR